MTQDADKLRRMIKITQLSWDERVPLHADDQTGLYDVPGFLAGRDTLSPIEHDEIGDVAGLKIAHLQCHFGMDTLSLARRGAEVTGLDYSPAAIAKAEELAAQMGLNAEFVRADVYDALDHLPAAPKKARPIPIDRFGIGIGNFVQPHLSSPTMAIPARPRLQ